MKSNVAAMIISLVCLFVIFESCSGLICYECFSQNERDPTCETITNKSDVHLVDYKEKAGFCMRMIVELEESDDIVDRVLRRQGFPHNKILDVYRERKNLRDHGFKVDLYRCEEDKCNVH